MLDQRARTWCDFEDRIVYIWVTLFVLHHTIFSAPSSFPNLEVNEDRARSVLRWETSWEHRVCEHPPFFACTDCDIDCSVAASECDDSDSEQVVLLSVIGSDQLLPVAVIMMINQHASVIVTEVRSNTCVLFVTVTGVRDRHGLPPSPLRS